MRKSLRFRVHEWAAERFSSVQYPNIRPVSDGARLARPGVTFTHKMPIWRRLELLMFSTVLLIVAIGALTVVGTIIWALI